jgi:hypothetical protein
VLIKYTIYVYILHALRIYLTNLYDVIPRQFGLLGCTACRVLGHLNETARVKMQYFQQRTGGQHRASGKSRWPLKKRLSVFIWISRPKFPTIFSARTTDGNVCTFTGVCSSFWQPTWKCQSEVLSSACPHMNLMLRPSPTWRLKSDALTRLDGFFWVWVAHCAQVQTHRKS